MPRLFKPILLLFLGLMAACDAPAMVTSPVAGSVPAQRDDRLLGFWTAIEADKSHREMLQVAVSFTVDQKGLMRMRLTFTGLRGQGKGEGIKTVWSNWELQQADLGGRTYFSARMTGMGAVPEPGPDDGEIAIATAAELAANPIYIIGWPEIDVNGALILHIIAEDELKARKPATMTVSPNASKGLVEMAGSTFVMSADDLAAMIRNGDPAQAFRGKLGPMVRVPPRESGHGLWSVRK